MEMWRLGLEPLPPGCIKFHKDLAEKELERLVKDVGYKVHNKWMDSDGWADGWW